MARVLPLALVVLSACGGGGDAPLVTYTEVRDPCAVREPTRRVLWGDLHVHGAFSFDARNYGSVVPGDAALAFAKGAEIRISPLDADGQPTRAVRLDRPLDFAALTEHSEFLAEVEHCTTPGELGYDADVCDPYQANGEPGDEGAAFDLGLVLAGTDPAHPDEICGEEAAECVDDARARWRSLLGAVEAAYDRTSTCGFTSFLGYEYTNSYLVSNLHRNVIFRNADVPDLPVSLFDAPTPAAFWQQLADVCLDAGGRCDAISIPHNSNLSNGRLFWPDDERSGGPGTFALRERLEQTVEIHQHKGQSECRSGVGNDGDPGCDFEQQRPPGDSVCDDDAPGTGGMRLQGCTHRLDYAREVLKEGLVLGAEQGVNPYHLAFIGSTDTHNATPGLVRSQDYGGHVGSVDDTPEERLADGNLTHDTFLNNPGGLAGVWAVENSRDAIFEAFHRREVFATSGPRIPVRLFAGPFAAGMCDDPDALDVAYRDGAPMGALLSGASATPTFYVTAEADPGSADFPGVGLARIEIVKGWLGGDGALHEEVVTVAESGDAGTLDGETCAAAGGADRLCAVWTDPDFSASEPAFWYARVLEVPTCRWSTRQCAAFPDDAKPDNCVDPGHIQPIVQQRAWSSAIWSEPR